MRTGAKNKSTENLKRGLVILFCDLHLLASLYVAQFMAWRIIRRRRKENVVRRKSFTLLRGGIDNSKRDNFPGISATDMLVHSSGTRSKSGKLGE